MRVVSCNEKMLGERSCGRISIYDNGNIKEVMTDRDLKDWLRL